MKILVIHSELGVLRGGGENFTRNLFSAFVQRGHRVFVAFVANPRKRYSIPIPSTIEPIPIPGWWTRTPGQRAFSSIRRCLESKDRLRTLWDRAQEAVNWRAIKWHDQRFQRRIELYFKDAWGEFDAVYVHGNTKLAKTIAQHRPTVLRLPGPVGPELATSLRQIHAVCANGDALRRVQEFLGDHVTELPIGVDVKNFHPNGPSVRAALGWNANDRVIGFVGRLTHLKGIDLLARAFCEVLHCEDRARLLIVGSGAEAAFVRGLLADCLAKKQVHIEPDVSHETLPAWYRAMDLLVMPSRYENFSNTVLEALACGRPFLASDVGGNKMLGRLGLGWLFDSESTSALVERLRALMVVPEQIRDRGNFGATHVRKTYTWELSARRLEEIISTIHRQEVVT